MSSATGDTAPPGLGFDHKRGSAAMWLFIVTEAALFVMLFFAYFYLGQDETVWPPEQPKIRLALIMLVLLLSSSAVLHVAERAERSDRIALARIAIAGTLAIAVAFLVLQGLEYRNHLKTLTPFTNAYGSIFYTITTLHGIHLLLGMIMLAYVLILPELSADRMPQRPVHNAALYWHFVDVVWVVIVTTLYVLPQFYGGN